jgi:hypothetical protein
MTVYEVAFPWDSFRVGNSYVFKCKEDAEAFAKLYNERLIC